MPPCGQIESNVETLLRRLGAVILSAVGHRPDGGIAVLNSVDYKSISLKIGSKIHSSVIKAEFR